MSIQGCPCGIPVCCSSHFWPSFAWVPWFQRVSGLKPKGVNRSKESSTLSNNKMKMSKSLFILFSPPPNTDPRLCRKRSSRGGKTASSRAASEHLAPTSVHQVHTDHQTKSLLPVLYTKQPKDMQNYVFRVVGPPKSGRLRSGCLVKAWSSKPASDRLGLWIRRRVATGPAHQIPKAHTDSGIDQCPQQRSCLAAQQA